MSQITPHTCTTLDGYTIASDIVCGPMTNIYCNAQRLLLHSSTKQRQDLRTVTLDNRLQRIRHLTAQEQQGTIRLDGVTVRASDLRSGGRGFDSRSGRYQAT